MKRVAFTVYRQWYDAINAGTKTVEYRDDKPPWRAYVDNPPAEAVFLCGRLPPLRFAVEVVRRSSGKIEFVLGERR